MVGYPSNILSLSLFFLSAFDLSKFLIRDGTFDREKLIDGDEEEKSQSQSRLHEGGTSLGRISD